MAKKAKQLTDLSKEKPETLKAAELKCGCCEQTLHLENGDDPQGLWCYGCKAYVCGRDTCSASPPGFGAHKPWQHKPCDDCGESVMDQGAASCENCL